MLSFNIGDKLKGFNPNSTYLVTHVLKYGLEWFYVCTVSFLDKSCKDLPGFIANTSFIHDNFTKE